MNLPGVIDQVQRQSAQHPILVFDLDSTLFSTQERNLAILREFVEEHGAPTDVVAVAESLTADKMGWNIADDLRSLGITDEPALAKVTAFWQARFFRGSYLHHDNPLPGAVAFVRAAHQAGGLVFYLTGRDEPNMGDGTRESLKAHDFPAEGDERVVLRMKPKFELDDLAFKTDIVDELRELGPVCALFENEPANANLFYDAFPDAHVFLLETIHAPNPPPTHKGIHRVADFS